LPAVARAIEAIGDRLKSKDGAAGGNAPSPLSYNSGVGAGGLLPEGEALRRAVAWLAEQPERSLPLIEEASQRFDLSPLDAAVLFRYFGPSVGDKSEFDQ
jgi:hypothetical protein